MGIRRRIGDKVLVVSATESEHKLRFRIVDAWSTVGVQKCMRSECKDTACRVWPNLDEIDLEGNATSRRILNVSECQMQIVNDDAIGKGLSVLDGLAMLAFGVGSFVAWRTYPVDEFSAGLMLMGTSSIATVLLLPSLLHLKKD